MLENRFVNLLLKIKPVKDRELVGTHVEDFEDILKDQTQLDQLLDELKTKFDEMKKTAQDDLMKNEAELKSMIPKLNEMKILRGEQHTNVEDLKLGHEDKLIIKMRQALNQPNTTPDDLINILTADMHERDRLNFQLQYMQAPS